MITNKTETGGIYFSTWRGIPIGPYHPDEWAAQQRAKATLSAAGHVNIYRIEAKSFEDARRKALAMPKESK